MGHVTKDERILRSQFRRWSLDSSVRGRRNWFRRRESRAPAACAFRLCASQFRAEPCESFRATTPALRPRRTMRSSAPPSCVGARPRFSGSSAFYDDSSHPETGTHMISFRLTFLVPGLAAFALFAGACSSGSDRPSNGTGTAGSSGNPGTGGGSLGGRGDNGGVGGEGAAGNGGHSGAGGVAGGETGGSGGTVGPAGTGGSAGNLGRREHREEAGDWVLAGCRLGGASGSGGGSGTAGGANGGRAGGASGGGGSSPAARAEAPSRWPSRLPLPWAMPPDLRRSSPLPISTTTESWTPRRCLSPETPACASAMEMEPSSRRGPTCQPPLCRARRLSRRTSTTTATPTLRSRCRPTDSVRCSGMGTALSGASPTSFPAGRKAALWRPT